MLATTGLDAGVFISRDHEFIGFQRLAVPLAGVQVEDTASFVAPGTEAPLASCTVPKIVPLTACALKAVDPNQSRRTIAKPAFRMGNLPERVKIP